MLDKTNYSTFSDQALVERMHADDKTAFRELYRRHWRRCYLHIARRFGDEPLAEDITQSVFVSLWEKRNTVEIKDIAAYLLTAVRFQCINYLKSQMRERAYIMRIRQRPVTVENPVEGELRIKELNAAIDKGMAMMPPKTKTVYTMSRNEHYSVKEIAHLLNLSEKAVEYHITQSLRVLRVALKDFLPLALIFSHFF